METFLVIVAIVAAILIGTLSRMRGAAKVPALFWVALLASGALPIWTGWQVLNPGETVDEVRVTRVKDHRSFNLPENHSLLVTARFQDEIEDKKDESSYKTAYSFTIQGDGWKEKVSGIMNIRQDDAQNLDAIAGETISESGKQKSRKSGSNMQERYQLQGSGKVDLLVSNYEGTIAKALLVEVIPSPPSALLLWSACAFLSLLGIYFEVWHKCDKVAGDLAGIAFYAVFLADGITPMSSFLNIASAFLPGMFLGWGLVAGLGFLVAKYKASVTPRKKEDK